MFRRFFFYELRILFVYFTFVNVPLKEIAKQFDTKVSYLESILRNNDIELVSKEEPIYKDTSKYWKYKNRY